MLDGEIAAKEPIVRPANVRLAGEADEAALYDLLMELERDNGFGIPSERERIETAIHKGTRRQGSMIGVIDGKDQLAASVNLILGQVWYSAEWHLQELWLFVHPDYRSNHFERDLFQFAKWCRQEMTAKLGQTCQLITSVSSPDRLDAKLRLWRRYARQVGGIFVVE